MENFFEKSLAGDGLNKALGDERPQEPIVFAHKVATSLQFKLAVTEVRDGPL